MSRAGTYPRADRPAASRLWFGLLGGPVAWSAAFLTTYLITESVCVAGGSLVAPGIVWLLATGVSVAAAVAAWGARAPSDPAGDAGDDELRGPEARTDHPTGRHFMASAGALLSGLFAFITLVHAMPLIVGVGC